MLWNVLFLALIVSVLCYLQKRRSSRNTNTKRKKYMDELDLDISDEDKDDENTPLVKTKGNATVQYYVVRSMG